MLTGILASFSFDKCNANDLSLGENFNFKAF